MFFPGGNQNCLLEVEHVSEVLLLVIILSVFFFFSHSKSTFDRMVDDLEKDFCPSSQLSTAHHCSHHQFDCAALFRVSYTLLAFCIFVNDAMTSITQSHTIHCIKSQYSPSTSNCYFARSQFNCAWNCLLVKRKDIKRGKNATISEKIYWETLPNNYTHSDSFPH